MTMTCNMLMFEIDSTFMKTFPPQLCVGQLINLLVKEAEYDVFVTKAKPENNQ